MVSCCQRPGIGSLVALGNFFLFDEFVTMLRLGLWW